ncbi:MAG TPA: RAMP superfamily CRISPR-associated protein [Burkholderiales bacterium]|nr:RAMP superfamily CRISPR-associated protein [Burkholderiales bacterium]
MTTSSYKPFRVVGLALDPIHVGTGGARLGRVDLTIVRDPVTRVPKIPGSSLAGVYRSYAAMQFEEQRANSNPSRAKPYFPDCVGQGQPDRQGQGGHCGQADCPICVTFGFARGQGGGFAGLASFTDAHVLLFPVATREGPVWVTSPGALRIVGIDCKIDDEKKIYRKNGQGASLNLGWLLLPVEQLSISDLEPRLRDLRIPDEIRNRAAVLSDKLFGHVVNSNLEVRTSVAIDPSTGAAEEGALFSFEALPRTTVLVWEVICRNPQHFKPGGQAISAQLGGKRLADADSVFEVVKTAHPYLEHLGIGGMGTRGMGRLKVVYAGDGAAAGGECQVQTAQEGDATHAAQNRPGPPQQEA